MDAKDNKLTRSEREKKRSRIRGIKNAIIAFVVIWIIASIAFMVFLTYKVFSLKSQLDMIIDTIDSGVLEDITDPPEMVEPATESGIISTAEHTAESNLAGLDDTIKVYLTFDDGPSDNTDAILDILDDYGIKATFFVQAKDPEIYGDRYRRIVEEGHTLGMHTYTHVYNQIYQSPETFANDVESIRDLIYDTTGVRTDYYRFPGGSSNGVSGGRIGEFISWLDDNGIVYYDWNVSSGDASEVPPSAQTIVENVTEGVVKYKTSVVLMHDSDVNDTTVEALPTIIEKLQQSGAIILPISTDTTVIQHVTLSDRT